VSAVTDPITAYPIVDDNGLDVDPRYRELQRHGPIKVQLAYGEPCWLATGYHDVKTVYSDRRFGKELGFGRVVPRVHAMPALDPALLANMDPPRHTRIRKLATPAFSRPRIRGARAWIETLVDELLDDLAQRDQPADFATVAWNLPNLVVTGILGVARADVPTFRSFIDTMLGMTSSTEARAEAGAELRSYLLGLVAERRAHPTEDVLNDLVAAHDEEDRLTEDELVMLCQSLFLGGFETTVAQLGSTLYVLLSRRALWEELLADPGLMPAALEELWRWIPSTRYGMPLPRWANEDVALSGGVVIAAGDAVLPERAVANRDESVFDDGWELDFHRDDPQPHLALGFGAHHCVGASLAQAEIEVTLARMLTRFPTLRLAVPPSEVTWSRTSMLRAVEALPVVW
jgi:cytochrome P450